MKATIALVFALVLASSLSAEQQPRIDDTFALDLPDGWFTSYQGGKEGGEFLFLLCTGQRGIPCALGGVVWGGIIKAVYGESEIVDQTEGYTLYRVTGGKGPYFQWVKEGETYTVWVKFGSELTAHDTRVLEVLRTMEVF